MEGRVLTAPPIVPLILAAIALTSRLRAPCPLTIGAIRRKGVLTPRPLARIPLPIGAILRRAVRILRPNVATLRLAARIPPRNVATLRPAVRTLLRAGLTLPLAAVTVAAVEAVIAAVVVEVRAAVVVEAGHRAAVVAVGLIDKIFNPFFHWPAFLQDGGLFSLFASRLQSQALVHNSATSRVFNR